MQYPFGQFRLLSWLCHPPACSLGEQGKEQRKPWHPGSTVQQHLKHRGAINTILVTSPQHADCDEAINSIPARSSMQCFISNKVSFFVFSQCSYLLSSFSPFCSKSMPLPSLHPLGDFQHCCLPQNKSAASPAYVCRQAGRGSGESCKCILDYVG